MYGPFEVAIFPGLGVLLGLLIIDIVMARRRAWAALPEHGSGLHDELVLGVVASVLALLRLPFALTRSHHSGDESLLAAVAAFVAHSGESIVSWPWPFRLTALPYRLSSLERPYLVVDVLTCFVVGATAFLLGWMLLRAQVGLTAAILAAVGFAIGIVPFEGLASGNEPFACLLVAGYLTLRLGRAVDARPPDSRRKVLGGALLGAAMMFEPRALPLALIEIAIIARHARLARAGHYKSRRPWNVTMLRDLGFAAAGLAIVPAIVSLAFASHGQLGGFFGAVGVSWWSLSATPRALIQLWHNPVSLLGLVFTARTLLSPVAGERQSRLLFGLRATAAVAIGATCTGVDVSPRDLQLAMLALAPLAALLIVTTASEWRIARSNIGIVVLLVVAVVNGVGTLRHIARPDGRALAEGLSAGSELAGVDAAHAAVEVVGARIRRWVAAGRPILVWGSQPQLYIASQRAPVTRAVDAGCGAAADMIADRERFGPPAAIVFMPEDPSHPESSGLAASRGEVEQWIDQAGYLLIRDAEDNHGYAVWLRPDAAR